MTTLYRLPKVGETVTVHTHLVVREDAHLLYGFAEKRERELFRELIRLNGVGPKLALALMSGLEVDELMRCVQSQAYRLGRAPGPAQGRPGLLGPRRGDARAGRGGGGGGGGPHPVGSARVPSARHWARQQRQWNRVLHTDIQIILLLAGFSLYCCVLC